MTRPELQLRTDLTINSWIVSNIFNPEEVKKQLFGGFFVAGSMIYLGSQSVAPYFDIQREHVHKPVTVKTCVNSILHE